MNSLYLCTMKSLILGSGLRVIVSNNDGGVAYCGIAVDSGTRDELDGERGMAHFTEHLSFKGTKTRTSRQIISRMESVGGELNAFTGKEETVYYCACQSQYMGRAMDLLADVVLQSTYPQAEMDKEVEVVVDEIESYNDSPSELIYDDFEALLFKGHPLGRNILGDAERLREYRTEDVRAYISRMYTPDRMVLFCSGPVEESDAAIMRMLRPVLARHPELNAGNAIPFVRKSDGIPAPSGSAYPLTVRMDKDTHQSHIMMGARAYARDDSRYLALYLASNILGGTGLSSRLNMALRERTGLVYTVDSSLVSYSDTGVWAVYFGCDRQDVARCKRLVTRELRRLCNAPLSERALSAAKRQLSGQIALAYENTENVAIGMGKRLLHCGVMQSREQLIERIAALTAQQVWDAAREVFNPDGLTILEYN